MTYSIAPHGILHRAPRSKLAVPAWLLGVLLCIACGRQAKGERCDPDNFNDDCESGLVCLSAAQLSQVEEGAICCPESRDGVGVCSAQNFNPLLGSDAGPEPSEPPPSSDEDAGKSPSTPDAGVNDGD